MSARDELERFVENTLSYIQREGHLLIDEPEIPDRNTLPTIAVCASPPRMWPTNARARARHPPSRAGCSRTRRASACWNTRSTTSACSTAAEAVRQ